MVSVRVSDKGVERQVADEPPERTQRHLRRGYRCCDRTRIKSFANRIEGVPLPPDIPPAAEYHPAALPAPSILLDQVTRRFGAVVAVRKASAHFVPGRIHALVGENGAGKSTLLGLAGGALPPSDGRVVVGDRPLLPASPAEAIRRGIGFVHQHFMLVEAFSALENIMLGSEPTARFGTIDHASARRRAKDVLDDLGLDLDLDARVADMGVGHRQNLEIVRVLVRGARKGASSALRVWRATDSRRSSAPSQV